MTSGGNATPPSSPHAGDDTIPPRQKESTLVIRTPGLESSRRRAAEDQEATKRRKDLQAQVTAKQAELEELLLLVSQEKGKKRADAQGSDSDETYDPLYDNLGDDGEEEADTQSTPEPEVVTLRKTAHGPGSVKGRSKQTLRSSSPPPSENRRTMSPGKERAFEKKSLRHKKHYVVSESSSDEEEAFTNRRKPGKDKAPEMLPPHAWEGTDQSTRMMARRALGRISASPFTSDICESEPPKKFQTPRFALYDGRSDPLAHYRHYMQAMTLWSWNNELMCRVFPSSLGDTALQWFHKLPSGSISCWEQLAEEFVTRFLANAKQPKTADVLLTMKKRNNESLRDYSRRYMELYNEVEGCSEQLAVTSFKLGLQKGDKLWLSLTKKPAVNMSELMCRIEKYAKVEDEIRPAEHKDTKPSSTGKGKEREGRSAYSERNKSVFEAVNTVFKEPIFRILPQILDKPYFRWPKKLPDFEGKEGHRDFCSYHRDRGHRTGACKSLRYFLEDLVKEGHLKEYIDDTRTRTEAAPFREQRGDQRRRREEPREEGVNEEAQPPPRNRPRRDLQRPPVIHVIHMENRPRSVVASAQPADQGDVPSGEVLRVTNLPTKRPRRNDGRGILFFDDGGCCEQTPHNDALVVTLQMFESEVKRILIDAGSSTEVMYLDLFKKLGLTEEDLEPAESPLIGFNSAPVWPLGRVTIPVRAGPAEHEVEFTVVDAPSSYNAIMGRSWIHMLRGVPSTYHQVLKFPFGDEVIEIRGDQISAKRCFMAALKSRPPPDQVQLTEMPQDTPKIDDVGGDPAKKVLEDLEKIRVGEPQDDRYFLIGSNLGPEEKLELTELLLQNLRTFAWTPNEMPGISPEIISHKLSVYPDARPVIQRARRSALHHAEAVIEEVGKLLEADAIREVSYPEWLANTVVVKKKTGKWRVCVDYTDLNKACPKDPFPLPKIDQLVDSTAGSSRMSFLDAYRGYHQIPLHGPDEEKTSFITPRGIYCYKVMPFGLKNAGATYQRLVTKMFKDDLGRIMEVYIDDMVVKSREPETHLQHLRHVFSTLDRYGLKLNAAKCAFGVSSGKFLGHLVTRRGIEADPDQIRAIQATTAPRTKKDVQKLTGMVAALNRFISRASDKCRPFFKLLKGANNMIWDEEADRALEKLKQYLTTAPILSTPLPGEVLQLYLAVSDHAVSAVLVREEERKQKPVYYASKTLQGAEAKYLPLEKFTLALIMASRKLAHYFHAHTIQVITEQPIGQLLKKADMTGRIAKWAVSLGAFDIRFMPRTAIKAQVLADFMAEFSPPIPEPVHEVWQLQLNVEPETVQEKAIPPWQIEVDGSSSRKGSGVGVVLTTPEGVTVEYAIRLGFEATNNEAEYEALLAGLDIARRLFAKNIIIKTDSQLVANQLSGEYVARNERMAGYLDLSKKRLAHFNISGIELVGRDHNSHADALATLAASPSTRLTNNVFIETREQPSVSFGEKVACIQLSHSWMDPIVAYLKDGTLPEDKIEAKKLRMKATRFWLSPNCNLYKKSFTGPYLLCVHPEKVQEFLYEIHEGVCGAHTGGRSLAHRAITQGYWWPKMGKDAQAYVRKCKKCQQFAPIPHQPARELSPLTSPWPFAQWGLDIIGPLPTATGNRKWLLVGTDYFTKWVEAEPLAHIRDADTRRFVWKSIITRYGIPRTLISDNGTQFDSAPFREYCSGYGIKNVYSTPAYPQSNGQAEASNKVILSGIKKRLETAKGRWVDELPSVLWTYRTTPRRSTGESPFSMAYGAEAVIPLEVGLPTIRTQAYDQGENNVAMGLSLDLIDEKRELAALRLANYQQKTKGRYNKTVRLREFQIGDFVLRKLMGTRKNPTEGKLGANWEGPFQIAEVLGNGAYYLRDLDGVPIKRPWNVAHLKLFHI